MAIRRDSYSRFIALAKIMLPLAALGLLSTLFLFSWRTDPTDAIPFARMDAKKLAREQQVNAPEYSSVTADGTAIVVSAATARPSPSDPEKAEATALNATLEFTDGSHANISSDKGTINSRAQLAVLEGNVAISTSSGYHITADTLTTALDHTAIVATGSVVATSPIGHVTAGEMRIDEKVNGKSGYLLVFKHGVKLIYLPKR